MQEIDGRPAAEEDDQHTGNEAEDCAEGLPVRTVVPATVEVVIAGEDLFKAFEAREGVSWSVCKDKRGRRYPALKRRKARHSLA